MKMKMKITEINHDDLVELLSTALYGSTWLGCDYRVGDNMEIVKFEESDTCIEDRAARCLLQGKYIEFLDRYAEGDDESYGELEHYWDYDDDCMVYRVTLKDIEEGLSKMFEGNGWVHDCVMRFVSYDDGWFDHSHAQCIMQYILFNEIIYG